MDLRFTGVPLKVGIRFSKIYFVAFPCVPLFVLLESWQSFWPNFGYFWPFVVIAFAVGIFAICNRHGLTTM